MPILDLCSQKLVTIDRGSSLHHAAQLMKKHHVGGVVVLESDGKAKPVGFLTDRDIVLSIVAENLPLTSRVEDVMSKRVFKVESDEGIASVVRKMEQSGVRRMVVVDSAGNACGLVTSDDLLQLLARELYGLGRLVEHQSEGGRVELPNARTEANGGQEARQLEL